MSHPIRKSFTREVQCQVGQLRTSSEPLPFRELLHEDRIFTALQAAGVEFRDRIFTPMTTLWAFLSQILSRDVGSCRDAVSRVSADRAARGEKPCSLDTSSYCAARRRLPESVVASLVRQTGQELSQRAKPDWKWRGRDVVIVDGTTFTMADTDENQAEYPQGKGQKPGLGFPMMRGLVVFSWTVGTVLDCAVSRCKGKGTGEQSLFRQVFGVLKSGQILLADRLFDCYRDIALLKARGVDVVVGRKSSRHCDFRCGVRLGPNDHCVVWERPRYDATRFTSKAEWESLPEEMTMREVRLTLKRGKSCRTIVVITTLLDCENYSPEEIQELQAMRWDCEVNLRSIKRALGAHHLQCKTPDMVRKELWMHLLAYNLIRVRIAQACMLHNECPRRVSFTATRILIHSFEPYFAKASKADFQMLQRELLSAIAQCAMRDRRGRIEPRALKRRLQKYPPLKVPRALARQRLAA